MLAVQQCAKPHKTAHKPRSYGFHMPKNWVSLLFSAFEKQSETPELHHVKQYVTAGSRKFSSKSLPYFGPLVLQFFGGHTV